MIGDILSHLLGGLWGYIAAAVGMLAVVVGAYFKGASGAKAKQRAKDAERKAKSLNEVMENQDEARKTSDADLADRLSRRK